MQKTALSDEILMQVDKPARYIGNELNSVVKDSGKVDIRFAMCFPDVYEVGMSHLGIQILYDMFNRREDTWCERVYSPWPDLHAIMKEKGIPLFALESQEPIRTFDFIGITIQYEMCYTNILQVLDLAQLPLAARDRTDRMPIVIGGGPCMYNPEPIAEFFDLFYIGEGEERYGELLDLYKQMKRAGQSREEFLLAAAGIEGIYVPSLYEVDYHEDGTIAAFFPISDARIPMKGAETSRGEASTFGSMRKDSVNRIIPTKIRRVVDMDLTNSVYPDKPVVPFLQAIQDRVVLEIQRGCIRGCRFCQAGMIYRPNREKDVEILKEQARRMLRATGYDEISLSSLSSSDYHQLDELVSFLIGECRSQGINISLPSLRIDAFSLDVMSKVQDVRKSSLTFAPEAGSQRMRNVINKGLTVDDIKNGARQAFLGGWNKVKLYFMLGLPTETEEDMRAIPELGDEIASLYYDTVPKEKRMGKCQISMSSSFFVPKPFTPFQWAVMYDPEEYLRRARIVKEHMQEQLNRKSLRYNWHEAYVTVLEGVLARGDRRVGQVIRYVYEHGQIFDAWSEYFHYEAWQEAFLACGVNPDFYTKRERSLEETLPWDFIDVGVTKEFLIREWQTARKESVTPNCRMRCSGCGARSYGGGVCFEDPD